MNAGHFAVVVGINRYPGISHLSKAKRDAQDFYDWLVDPTGGQVPGANVEKVILDDREDRAFDDPLKSRPTLSDVDLALRRVNRDALAAVDGGQVPWEQTRLYLYASGHGITPSGGVGALLLATAARQAYDMTLDNMEIERYRDWYRASAVFREIVVFADCCREHRALTPAGGPPFDHPHRTERETFWAVGFATELGDRAHEPTQNGDDMRGFYTKALMDGLRGGAADLETGEITTETLKKYVQTSVEWQIKGKPFSQKPKLSSEVDDPLVLRPGSLGPLPRPERTITLRIVGDAPDECVLYRRGGPTEHRLRPGDGTVKLTLPEDPYQVRGPDGAVLTGLRDEGQFRVIAVGRDVEL